MAVSIRNTGSGLLVVVQEGYITCPVRLDKKAAEHVKQSILSDHEIEARVEQEINDTLAVIETLEEDLKRANARAQKAEDALQAVNDKAAADRERKNARRRAARAEKRHEGSTHAGLIP